MAMARQDDAALADGGQLGRQMPEDIAVPGGRGVTDGVRQIDGRRAGFDGGERDFFEKFQFGSARILGREFDVGRELTGVLDRFDGQPQDLFLAFTQLVLAMNLARRQEQMNPAARPRWFDRFAGPVDVLGRAPRQATDDAVAQFRCNGPNALEVAGTADWEPGFDDVDAHGFEDPRDLELFGVRQCPAGGLFAVAQGRVENADRFGFGCIGHV